jgi:hypothetical protein
MNNNKKLKLQLVHLLYFLRKIDFNFFKVYFPLSELHISIIKLFIPHYVIFVNTKLKKDLGVSSAELEILLQQCDRLYEDSLIVVPFINECLDCLSLIFTVLSYYKTTEEDVIFCDKNNKNKVILTPNYTFVAEVFRKDGILFSDLDSLKVFINSVLFEYCNSNVFFPHFNLVSVTYQYAS